MDTDGAYRLKLGYTGFVVVLYYTSYMTKITVQGYMPRSRVLPLGTTATTYQGKSLFVPAGALQEQPVDKKPVFGPREALQHNMGS